MDPWPWNGLQPLAYDVIVIDPPWPWATRTPKGAKKSPSAQYKLMTEEEIRRLPVAHLAGYPCLLLCWATVPLIHKQIDIVRGWGFRYQTAMMWHKVYPSGKTAMGTGYRVRSMVEPVIVATLGSPQHKPFPGLFRGVRREHSRKPREFYGLVDRLCPELHRRADVYARCRRPGWDSFGDELDKFPVEEAA